VNRLKSRILIGVTASTYVQKTITTPPKQVVKALHQAFIDQEILEIGYQREGGEISRRLIEPHYLMLKFPVWYIVALDHLRGAARTFRCDRIQTAKMTGKRFQLLPKKELQSSMDEDSLLI